MLNEIAQRKKPVSALDQYLAKDSAAFPASAYRMYFTSNHDENSWSGSEFERMGANHQPAFVLSATLRQSMPLIYTGQEASLAARDRPVMETGPPVVRRAGLCSEAPEARATAQALLLKGLPVAKATR